ncbi:TlpA family protein disulfide reductase [Shewanella violacea]|uniref:Thioredoxin family protein n=1 Tax=Shewanella violacea (strain JCM 10179 / CIP 106290 / LMG 19151 / DSS12) TaxID=637905 RepID=D4ZHU5_SHEVD|nr:TlpA disulfide reductase family protein [Shewanella violacea]BAJ01244.1 thioredoxin family protein [Shewanella violacea DSS12]
MKFGIKAFGLATVLLTILGLITFVFINPEVNSLEFSEDVKLAPKFALVDPQGKVHQWSEYKGKPIIIHFWATWCPYCKKLQPGLDKLRVDYSDSDLQILGISFNEDEGADPALTLMERGIQFPTLVQGESAAKAYGVAGTPTTVFINRRGEIVWLTNISDPNSQKLKDATEFILQD